MQVRSLGREAPLEGGIATHSSVLAGMIPRTEAPSPTRGHKESDMTEHTHTQVGQDLPEKK